MKIIRETPLIHRTDSREYRLYFRERVLRVHTRSIKFGEIVPSAQAVFTLRAEEFAAYPEALDALAELISSMRGERR